MVEAISSSRRRRRGASYEVLVRCGGVAAQSCARRVPCLVVCLCERNTRRQPQQLWPCKIVFSAISIVQKEAQYELFLPQPQRFPSVLLTLASLLFAADENKWKKCHRFSSDEA